MYTASILTISDKGSRGERADATGPAIAQLLAEQKFKVSPPIILPDEQERISSELIRLCDEEMPSVIFTNGGTGFSKRDVTPEATLFVLERLTPGFCEVMRQKSLEITPKAMLSRAVSGIRKNTIIINLPGSPKGAVENLLSILPALFHGIDILTGSASECAAK